MTRDDTRIEFPDLADGEIRVSADRLPVVREALSRLNAKAARLGVPAPEVVEVRVEDLDVLQRDERTREWVACGTARFHIFTASAAPVRFSGWSFVATIQHEGSAGNIVKASPTFKGDLPTSYRHDGPTCDHCGLDRARKETFVLQHEGADFSRVGRQCLKDFLGTDNAAALVAYAGLVSDLEGAMSDEEGGYGWGGGVHSVDPEKFLSWVAAVIDVRGWMSRGVARDRNVAATVDIAWDHVFPPPRFKREIPAPTDEQAAEARAALAWISTQEATSDYIHNCKVIATIPRWTGADIGIGGSILSAYRREQDRLNLQKFERRLPSVHLPHDKYGGKGTKKDPRPAPLDVVVLGVYVRDTDFGAQTIIRMQTPISDDTCADLVWFASGVVDVKVGDKATLSGSVKRRETSTRTGRAETHMTRCTLEVRSDDTI
jgi:hypothetical protein